MQIIIDEMFKSQYLTCGKTYDNFIFENCPKKFVEYALTSLSEEAEIKPCNVKITHKMEEKVESTLANCTNKIQQDILARDFVTLLVMKEVLKNIPEKSEEYDNITEQIKAFYGNDFLKVKQCYANSYFVSDVADFSKNNQKIELNFFLIELNSKTIQKAINNFISSRTPYSIKVFTTNSRLVTYYDQAGNLIQPPHDYMTRDVNRFIEFCDKDELRSENG